MTIALPTAKTPPSLSLATVKGLLYGPPKIGKSTLVRDLDPDHTLFLRSEPGMGGLEHYGVTISSWAEFREVGALLAKGEHPYKVAAVDTVDELIRMCTDDVLTRLGVSHASELEFGKGWAAIAEEFRLRIARLTNLGLGVWFVSHSKDIEIKTKVGTVTKSVPDIGGQARSFLIGFCDVIVFATADGTDRVLRTTASENWEAGGRVTLTDPLPLDAAAFRADFERAAKAALPGAAQRPARVAQPRLPEPAGEKVAA